ncbi:hypothetical protein PAPYR_5163 [Paratrimastix pyriformis]|uniref:F-box domain-containing protein n=1 Tax=Paratrimastix pyriformis TaxID=342808 RepID=A0ABQ8ULQ3_9EUKA|nr:hypothetical protein PAPYR_5163 [Paratrimastix pyriformis]
MTGFLDLPDDLIRMIFHFLVRDSDCWCVHRMVCHRFSTLDLTRTRQFMASHPQIPRHFFFAHVHPNLNSLILDGVPWLTDVDLRRVAPSLVQLEHFAYTPPCLVLTHDDPSRQAKIHVVLPPMAMSAPPPPTEHDDLLVGDPWHSLLSRNSITWRGILWVLTATRRTLRTLRVSRMRYLSDEGLARWGLWGDVDSVAGAPEHVGVPPPPTSSMEALWGVDGDGQCGPSPPCVMQARGDFPSSGGAAGLEKLVLHGCYTITGVGLTAMLAACPRLRVLHVMDCQKWHVLYVINCQKKKVCRILVLSTSIRSGLEELRLDWLPALADRALASILASNAATLKRLSVCHCPRVVRTMEGLLTRPDQLAYRLRLKALHTDATIRLSARWRRDEMPMSPLEQMDSLALESFHGNPAFFLGLGGVMRELLLEGVSLDMATLPAMLAKMPQLTSLSLLPLASSLDACALDPPALRAIPNLCPALTRLALRKVTLTEGVLMSFAGLSRLVSLALVEVTGLTDEALGVFFGQLARQPCPALAELDLSDCPGIGPELFLASPNLARTDNGRLPIHVRPSRQHFALVEYHVAIVVTRTLCLARCRLSAPSLRALVTFSSRPLRHLDLNGVRHADDAFLEALARSGSARLLETLYLSGTGVTHSGIRALLAACRPSCHLRRISLPSGCLRGMDAVPSLPTATPRRVTRAMDMGLACDAGRGEGDEGLLGCPLEWLSLGDNVLSPDQLRGVPKAALRSLDLAQCAALSFADFADFVKDCPTLRAVSIPRGLVESFRRVVYTYNQCELDWDWTMMPREEKALEDEKEEREGHQEKGA